MPEHHTERYAEPFFQTILLTTRPVDAIASRLIVDALSDSAERQGDEGSISLLTPLAEKVRTPDWTPQTLQDVLGARTEADPDEVPPLDAITGGPDITVPELADLLRQRVSDSVTYLTNAKDFIGEGKVWEARVEAQLALTALTQAQFVNLRLHSTQLGLREKLAQSKDAS